MQNDKILHALAGVALAFFARFFGITGLLIGYVIIVGWELQQLVFDSGTFEFMDMLYGAVPLTAIWMICNFTKKK